MSLIELRNLRVDFPVYGVGGSSFRNSLFSRQTGGVTKQEGNRITITALQDINLDIIEGERVGLVGHNGSGKSTLLRVLAGVYEPSSGTAVVKGHVSSLFNPSLGIDMDESAIENIKTIGMFLGMDGKEVDSKIDDIAEFSGLGEYLYLPVKTYSSGMVVRLSFAISTAVEPEILLLDEGFGMADMRFAEQAQARVDALLERCKVVVLATHNEILMQQMCEKAVLLEQGRIVVCGPVDEVFKIYNEMPPGDLALTPDSLYQESLAAINDDNHEKALTLLRHALSLEPEHLLSKVTLVQIYRHIGKFDDAFCHCEELLSTSPDNTEYRFMKAAVLFSLKETESALEELKRILKQEPSHTRAAKALKTREI